MDRRDFLKGSSAAAIGLGSAAAAAKAADDARALAAPAIIPQRRTLRMASLWPDAVTGPGDHVRRFARRMEAASDGRWTIEIAKEPAVGANAFKAVMTGEADLYAGHEHAHRELHPAFSYFAGLPCGTGLNIDELDAWLVAAGGQDLWDDLAGAFNMKSLVIGHSGRAHGLWTRMQIEQAADFKDKRIAVLGIAADVLQAHGAIPIQDALPSTVALIASREIDGADIIGPSEFTHLPHAAATANQKPVYYVTHSINHGGYALTLGLRRSLWDVLANSERIMLSALASEALLASRADAHADARMTPHIYDMAAQFAAFNEVRISYRLADQFASIAAPIVADIAGHDEHSRRINASYMAFKGIGAPPPTA
ncbi:MAG: twin-arginine translocation signal domain-containing protein [Hyphomicrobiaceae bacterium]|nr:twin-arginine translocation signal domain-containing protein [Hyphomicrobiaceae bacterium]